MYQYKTAYRTNFQTSSMKLHTSIIFALYNRSIISVASNQKISRKSSTEAELVGTDNSMLIVIQAKYIFKTLAEYFTKITD